MRRQQRVLNRDGQIQDILEANGIDHEIQEKEEGEKHVPRHHGVHHWDSASLHMSRV